LRFDFYLSLNLSLNLKWFKPYELQDDRMERRSVRLLDQRRLPGKFAILTAGILLLWPERSRAWPYVVPPAIGVAASMGIALAAQKSQTHNLEVFSGI
jgi:methylthioribose-1-phosphate isomerase